MSYAFEREGRHSQSNIDSFTRFYGVQHFGVAGAGNNVCPGLVCLVCNPIVILCFFTTEDFARVIMCLVVEFGINL